MGLNRNLLMGQSIDLKNIKAMMTVELAGKYYGFSSFIPQMGKVSPSPLPNGIKVISCCYATKMILYPTSIKSCTINNINITPSHVNAKVLEYLQANVNKTIPVIFHFD